MSPVNQMDLEKLPTQKVSKADKELVRKLQDRITDLKSHRSALKANHYDDSSDARTLEDTWDYCDYVSLPHKYSHPYMQDWMADNSHPLIMAKIDTALSVIIAKNPEVELAPRTAKFDGKAKILEALYKLSWDKGDGRQQLIKFAYNAAKYGFAVGREYHRHFVDDREIITRYDPEGNHETETQSIVVHDEPYFEVLPIRDCWFDDQSKPFDYSSIRDWCWVVKYDYSTFLKKFKQFPNHKYIVPYDEEKDNKDISEVDVISQPAVKLYFYENKEDNEFIISDGIIILFKGTLSNGELSCVPFTWKMRNEFTLYGLGIAEQLENSQEMLDRIGNMTLNQIILTIGGAGYYGGKGNVTEEDLILEPKLKKLRDADEITFPKIPAPDQTVLQIIEFIQAEADEISGVTKSLGGEQVGKTLGEAVMNREAGLRRLSLPLQNLEFALERHAKLRIDNIQMIYSTPVATEVVMADFTNIVSKKRYEEYILERDKTGQTPALTQKFPQDDQSGEMFRNVFRTERIPDESGEGLQSSAKDMFTEITPDEIRGQYDIRIRAMSTIPVSQTLEEAKTVETFNLVAQLPYTDLYSAQRELLKARKVDPDIWMIDEEQVAKTQQEAEGGMPPEGAGPDSFGRGVNGMPQDAEGGPPKPIPPSNLQGAKGIGGISEGLNNSLNG